VRRTLLSALAGLVTSTALAASMVATSGTVLAVPRTVSVSQKAAADHSLTAVACVRTSDCWAVGDYGANDVIYSSLAEHWNGTKWAVWKPPDPTSATALSGVSCIAASDCWAVGFASSGPPSDSDSPVAEYWDGTEWQAATPLSPSAFSSFDAIDCTSRTNCWDVGTSANLALIERWVDVTGKGPEWLLETTPNLPGATRSTLTSVSCASASDCWAVGYYTNRSDVEETLAEHWTGTKWTVRATPKPSRSTLSTLTGVACTGRTNCWAIGYYANSADLDKTLAEHWNGTKWTVKATPNPSRSKLGVLNGIACTRSTSCTAIGYYARGSDIVTLSEHWNGTKWTVQPSPNPSGPTLSELNGIACPRLTDCWAVGDSGQTQQTPSRTLAELWNGTKWKVRPTPNP
jgi:hypothetical protein